MDEYEKLKELERRLGAEQMDRSPIRRRITEVLQEQVAAATATASSPSSVRTPGPAARPSPSQPASPASTPEPSIPVAPASDSFKSIIQAIVNECDEWLRGSEARNWRANLYWHPNMRDQDFSSFLRSTLQRHMTSGESRVGDRGPADPCEASSSDADWSDFRVNLRAQFPYLANGVADAIAKWVRETLGPVMASTTQPTP